MGSSPTILAQPLVIVIQVTHIWYTPDFSGTLYPNHCIDCPDNQVRGRYAILFENDLGLTPSFLGWWFLQPNSISQSWSWVKRLFGTSVDLTSSSSFFQWIYHNWSPFKWMWTQWLGRMTPTIMWSHLFVGKKFSQWLAANSQDYSSNQRFGAFVSLSGSFSMIDAAGSSLVLCIRIHFFFILIPIFSGWNLVNSFYNILHFFISSVSGSLGYAGSVESTWSLGGLLWSGLCLQVCIRWTLLKMGSSVHS